jgi:eukaryotic-like serine/threonine-protein kinase
VTARPAIDIQDPDGSRCLALGQAAEEIGAALSAGREPNIEGIIARHPGIEEEIRDLLPALLVLGGAERSGVVRDSSGSRSPEAAETTAPPPLEIGDFRIVREIGRGGMGVVYEAEQVSLGRRVALKILPFAAVLDPRQVARFRNEAQAAAALHHTHIVPVHAVGCDRGIHYYAMQYIDGQSLAELIDELRRRSSPPPAGAETGSGRQLSPAGEALSSERSGGGASYWRSIARLGAQAAEALDHAHEMGIVHRDIKPSNLLLDVRGNLWVTDFGLARAQNESGLTLSGDILGTLRYMSPEGALGKRGAVDGRSDLYSLGATLYELLTLAPALPGKERREILEKIAFAEPVAPRRLAPSVPRDLETIVLKALAKEPKARYATAREMAADLTGSSRTSPSGRGVRGTSGGPSSGSGGTGRSRRRWRSWPSHPGSPVHLSSATIYRRWEGSTTASSCGPSRRWPSWNRGRARAPERSAGSRRGGSSSATIPSSPGAARGGGWTAP